MTKQYTFQRPPLKGFKLHVLNLFQPQKQRQFYSRNQKPMGVTAASQLQKLAFPIQSSQPLLRPIIQYPEKVVKKNVLLVKSNPSFFMDKNDEIWWNNLRNCLDQLLRDLGHHVIVSVELHLGGEKFWPPLENYHGVFFSGKKLLSIYIKLSIYRSIYVRTFNTYVRRYVCMYNMYNEMVWNYWKAPSVVWQTSKRIICKQMGVSENSVPLNPMVNDHYPY